jgi:hypothetical protein
MRPPRLADRAVARRPSSPVAPQEPVSKPEAYAPQQEEERDQGHLDTRDEAELEELEDAFADDRFLEQYRWVARAVQAGGARKDRLGRWARGSTGRVGMAGAVQAGSVGQGSAKGLEFVVLVGEAAAWAGASMADTRAASAACLPACLPAWMLRRCLQCCSGTRPPAMTAPHTPPGRRQQRLEELRRGASRPQFGSVEQIRGSEFVAQVTNAPTGVWVVVHLYKDR